MSKATILIPEYLKELTKLINKTEKKLKEEGIEYNKVYTCDGQKIQVIRDNITYSMPECINLL